MRADDERCIEVVASGLLLYHAERVRPRKGGAPKGWGSEGWGPKGGAPKRWRAQNFALFLPFPATVSLSLCLSGCLLVEFWWCLKRRGPAMCTFGVLGLSCASPGGPVWWGRRGFTRPPVRRGPKTQPQQDRTTQQQKQHNNTTTKQEQQQQQPPSTTKFGQNTKTQKLAKVGLAKVGQHSKTLKLAKISLAKVGQAQDWPKSVEKMAKVGLAKVGLAKVGHDRATPLLEFRLVPNAQPLGRILSLHLMSSMGFTCSAVIPDGPPATPRLAHFKVFENKLWSNVKTLSDRLKSGGTGSWALAGVAATGSMCLDSHAPQLHHLTPVGPLILLPSRPASALVRPASQECPHVLCVVGQTLIWLLQNTPGSRSTTPSANPGRTGRTGRIFSVSE